MAGWWADWDSNPDSKDYESSALTIKLSARLFAPLSRTWEKVTSDKWPGRRAPSRHTPSSTVSSALRSRPGAQPNGARRTEPSASRLARTSNRGQPAALRV